MRCYRMASPWAIHPIWFLRYHAWQANKIEPDSRQKNGRQVADTRFTNFTVSLVVENDHLSCLGTSLTGLTLFCSRYLPFLLMISLYVKIIPGLRHTWFPDIVSLAPFQHTQNHSTTPISTFIPSIQHRKTLTSFHTWAENLTHHFPPCT